MKPVDHALALADENIPVFPCKPNKAPITASGFKDATTDAGIIAGWWMRFPDALVAVPTGAASGLLVIDIDPDGAEWHHRNIDRLRPGRVHKTRRGHHLLYRMPDTPIASSASKLSKGVDVRGEGGYIIWWPAHGHEAVGYLSDITPPPSGLVAALQRRREGAKAQPTDWVAVARNGAPAGCRNATLAKIAGHAFRYLPDPHVARELCLAWAASRCHPPMDSVEAEQTIQSIAAAELRRRESE